MKDPITDTLVDVTLKMSVWYKTYVLNPDLENTKFNNRFRRGFRCSYQGYSKLLTLIKSDVIFD